jgi:hypothetical protein
VSTQQPPLPQAIALLDTLDKDVNTFVMRVREWYSWHFPELVKIVNDNYQYAKVRRQHKAAACRGSSSNSRGDAQLSGSAGKASMLLPGRVGQAPMLCLCSQNKQHWEQPSALPASLSSLPALPTHSRPSLSFPAPQLALLIKDKGSLSEESMPALQEIVGEEDKAREIVEVRACFCEGWRGCGGGRLRCQGTIVLACFCQQERSLSLPRSLPP